MRGSRSFKTIVIKI
ncbi:hypothetical protein LINPERHAP2_LOCUS35309 [Linum perenne]